MRFLAVTIAVAASLLPAAARACGGEGYESLGSASFTPNGGVTALVAGSESYRWLQIAADERNERGSLDVAPWQDGAIGPRIRATEDRLFALIGDSIHDVGAATTLRESPLTGVVSFDVSRGTGWVLAATFYDGNQLALFDDRGHGLRELARATAECSMDQIAVGRFADGSIAGLCGNTPFRLDGDVLSLEAPLDGGSWQVVESAGLDLDGSLVFFGVRAAPGEIDRAQVVSLRRSLAGAWSSDVVAVLPIGFTTEGRFATAGPDALSVAGVDDSGNLTLYAIRRTGGADLVDVVATIRSDDRLSASGDAASMRILSGGYRLSLFERSDDRGWTESSLGKIGKRVEYPGCSLTGVPAGRLSASVALFLLAAIGAAVARRRA